MPDVAKYRLNSGESLSVQALALVRIDTLFHALRVRQRRCLMLVEEGDLACLGLVRVTQTLRPQRTFPASVDAALKLVMGTPIDGTVAAVGVQHLTCGTDAGVGLRVIGKVDRAKQAVRLGSAFIVQRIGPGFVFLLVGKTLITLTHAVVGDQGVNLQGIQCGQIGF